MRKICAVNPAEVEHANLWRKYAVERLRHGGDMLILDPAVVEICCYKDKNCGKYAAVNPAEADILMF